MDRREYFELRASLDFSHKPAWMVWNALVDLVLVGWPLGWLFNCHFQLSASWTEAGLCVMSAASLAIFYFRSFSMMHEGVHGIISPARGRNDWAGLAYGCFCFLPFEHWKEIHLLHHQWAGNVEKDPVMKLILEFRKPPTKTHRVLSAMWKSWFPILAIMQNYVFWYVCVSRFAKNRSMPRFLSLVAPLALWMTVFALSPWPVTLAVWIPSIFLYMCMVEMINLPHHLDLPQYGGDTKLALWDQYKIARSCFYSRLFSRLVLLNFNYHTEHHLFPNLPWYRLDDLSARLKGSKAGYNYTLGNRWLFENRTKTLTEVCRNPENQDAGESAA